MSVLQCQGGKWVDVQDCTDPDKCIIDGQGGYCGLPGSPDPLNVARDDPVCPEGAFQCS